MLGGDIVRRTFLYEFHKSHARMAEYAGFEMPLWYRGAVEEHLSVRNAAGVFDVSHMGRILVQGDEVGKLLDYILTNTMTDLKPMVARHAFFCNPTGGVIDDVMAFRLGEKRFLLIVNAVNTEKDLRWMRKNASQYAVDIEDVTDELPMIAVQGPKAIQTIQRLTEFDLASLSRFTASWIPLLKRKVMVSRTGYTGEDGLEVYIFLGDDVSEFVVRIWEETLSVGKEFGVEPCGLAARDTLRLETGLCLYGNELDEWTTPLEAGLQFGVKLDGREFIGEEALQRQVRVGVKRVRVGFKAVERGVPRSGMEILAGDRRVGTVTSGTFSPLLKVGIGMGYVLSEFSTPGPKVGIMVRDRPVDVEIVKLPFYDQDGYGWRRKTG